MQFRGRALLVVGLGLFGLAVGPGVARADQGATNSTTTPPTPPKLEITAVSVEGRGTREEFAVGNTIVITLGKGNIDALDKAKSQNNPVGLFLNGLFIKGIDAARVTNVADTLRFQLLYTTVNKDAWSQLFARKIGGSENGDRIHVAVGLSDASMVSSEYKDSFALEFLPDKKAHAILWLSILLVAATVILSKWSSMLRDSGAPRTDGRPGTYSLGRTQMAVWFATIVFAFLFIYAVTGAAPPITQGALILMGIGAGTALGAAAIDENKKTASSADLVKLSAERLSLEQKIKDLQQTKPPDGDANMPAWQKERKDVQGRLDAVIAQLAPVPDPQVPASENLIKDLLTDVNGISFHRLQILVWMVVFWALFLSSVFGKLTMMDFDTTQLALMGISGTTYLGFKFAEKQS
jgi:hypothetical protein